MSQHPVDALKDLGLPISPEHEARMREICDGLVDATREALDSAMVGDETPRIITRVMDDGVKTKDGAA